MTQSQLIRGSQLCGAGFSTNEIELFNLIKPCNQKNVMLAMSAAGSTKTQIYMRDFHLRIVYFDYLTTSVI